MKIRPMGAELFHADGRADMTKLIVAFRNFANAPKKSANVPQMYDVCSELKYTRRNVAYLNDFMIHLLLVLTGTVRTPICFVASTNRHGAYTNMLCC
jgi:hypothetical protein